MVSEAMSSVVVCPAPTSPNCTSLVAPGAVKGLFQLAPTDQSPPLGLLQIVAAPASWLRPKKAAKARLAGSRDFRDKYVFIGFVKEAISDFVWGLSETDCDDTMFSFIENGRCSDSTHSIICCPPLFGGV